MGWGGKTDGMGMEEKEDVAEGCRVLPRESGTGVKDGDIVRKHWPLWLELPREEYCALACAALNLSWRDRPVAELKGTWCPVSSFVS